MAKLILDLLNFDNPIFKVYCFWSSILVIKMLSMSLLTGFQRFRTKTFANPEDLPSKRLKVKFDDPDVERIRRAHRNDLENILPFFAIGFLYVLTDPPAFLAINLFRAVAFSRLIHTVVYAIYVVPQPARAISFFVGLGSTMYMAIKVMFYCL